MTLKYNFSIFNAANDPVSGAIFEINNASSGFFSYVLLFVLFIITSYVIAKKTNDVSKSLLMSLHIVVIISLVMFYMGKIGGYVLIPEILMLFLIVVESFAIGGMYYMRMTKNQ